MSTERLDFGTKDITVHPGSVRTIDNGLTQAQPSPQLRTTGYLALIDRRALERECLAHGLAIHNIGMKVVACSDLEEWGDTKRDLGLPRAILFNAGNTDINDENLSEEIKTLVTAMAPTPVIVLSNSQELPEVLHIIQLGVRGYIPSSVSIDVCIQAIGLAIAGGRFVPASSLLNMRESLGISKMARPASASTFTSRQSAVAQALRCGKANKVIASELNLCESTIKVHIRNIMKKLGATNRTEVACKIGDIAMKDRAC
jgi:DNA-binding NarL/FixJ family response regulator